MLKDIPTLSLVITLVFPGCCQETSEEPLLIAGPVSFSTYNMSFYDKSVPLPHVYLLSSFCE